MNFLPHGYCFAWTPNVLWSMVGSDSLIAVAYFSIPLAIVTVVRRRPDVLLGGPAWLFSAFIFACGVTHVMDVVTIWQPYYRLETLAKLLTAMVSVVTAIVLWRLIPRMLAVPSVSQLQAAIRSMEAEADQRLRAEDSLVDSRQGLAVTLASIGAGYIAADREGRVTHMNAVAETLTGRSETDVRGCPFWDVFVPGDPRPDWPLTNPVDLIVQRGITVDTRLEFDLTARDGGCTRVELRADLTRGRDGQIRGAVMVFRDLTRILRAEAEARRLAAIVESSDDAIIGKDMAGNIVTWNQAAATMFGYTAEEAVGRSVLMLVPPGRREAERGMMTTLARGHRIPTFDTMGLAKDGTERVISVTISPILDPSGAVVGASRSVRDVSQERRAQAALRDSEAKLRFTMEAARIGEWDLDLKGGESRISRLHARCFGYEEVPARWDLDSFTQHVHPDDRAGVNRIIAAGLEAQHGWDFDCRVVWPDDSVHWIAVHGSALFENGRAVRLLGIVSDITEQRLAEEARLTALRLAAENSEIQQASRLKSLFLANMSHELRTPLNAIIGFSDLLHSGAVPAGSAKNREFLGHISTSGRQLLQLINDILDLSKVEAGKVEFKAQPLSLPALMQEVREMFMADLQRKSVALVVDLDPVLNESIKTDPGRLRQALCNYVSNAIKFTRPGGHVTIRAREEGPAHFRIEVEDDGIGIAEADIPKLFSEFQQLDAGLDKQHQGTGLGLALTRRLIEAQGGRVGVRSELGRGSVFYLVMSKVHGSDQPNGAKSYAAIV
jgi:PAS domain S-box-containing protein